MANCTYCNSNLASTRDHVIPRSWSGNESFADRYVVPCCRECNGLLGPAPCHTVEERAGFLYQRYSWKYRSELATEDWTPKQLKELSGSLKKHVVSKEKHKKMINSKLINLRELGKNWLTELIEE